jgi:predicted RNase H-like HicB family nuclease
VNPYRIAYGPELTTILVTARSLEEQTTRATEAIRLYLESVSNAEALN